LSFPYLATLKIEMTSYYGNTLPTVHKHRSS
jgi:hypothetical protein